MSNLYQDSEDVISQLKSGAIPKGSVIRIQHPSGNSEAVRVHRYNLERSRLVGCNTSWDNLATEWYDLSGRVVSLIEKADPDDERWKS